MGLMGCLALGWSFVRAMDKRRNEGNRSNEPNSDINPFLSVRSESSL